MDEILHFETMVGAVVWCLRGFRGLSTGSASWGFPFLPPGFRACTHLDARGLETAALRSQLRAARRARGRGP